MCLLPFIMNTTWTLLMRWIRLWNFNWQIRGLWCCVLNCLTLYLCCMFIFVFFIVFIFVYVCRGRFECALYGKYVKEFQQMLRNASIGLHVIVMQSARISSERGLIIGYFVFIYFDCNYTRVWLCFCHRGIGVAVVKTEKDITRVLVNPPIAEVLQFKKWYKFEK